MEDSLSEQKLKGHRLVISEVDGSDDDDCEESDKKSNEESDTGDKKSIEESDTGDKQSIADSLLSHDVFMSNGLQSNSAEMPDMLTKGERKPACMFERTTEPGEESSTHARQKKPDQVMSDPTFSSGKNETENLLEDESMAIALPRKVARLKQEGNQLFRSGQYAESIEKYTAGIAELSPGMFSFLLFSPFLQLENRYPTSYSSTI